MARTTLRDKNRKARIREREHRQLQTSLRMLDNITDDQIAAIKKIKAAEAKGKPVKATSIENWEDLRAMGVVKEQDGALVLTANGATVAASGE
jgi:hypothetical protein